MIDRDKIINALPIADYLARNGFDLKRDGKEQVCLCPFHSDSKPSLRVNTDKGTWYCFPCGFGGSIIDFEMRYKDVGIKDAFLSLSEMAGVYEDPEPKSFTKTATYEYKDQYARPVMEVERLEAGRKKKFIQYSVDRDGNRKAGIDGVKRVLYRIEKWADHQEVALTEGEKCVHALEALGFDATTNPGGSASWMDAYAVYLKDKHIDIFPDNDEAGEKWVDVVLASLEGKVASLRVCRMPKPYNDVADVINSMGDEMAAEFITAILEHTPRVERGVDIPLYSSYELLDKYETSVHSGATAIVDLGKWLPSFKKYARPLSAGDVMLVACDTGVGKTTILANIATSQRPVPTILFELELSEEPMTERFIAHDRQIETLSVESSVKRGTKFDVSGWDHIFVAPTPGLTIERMESIIEKAQLKMKDKPRLILLDYVGLMQGKGNRRERLSDVAEGLKILAMKTQTAIVLATQIKRDDDRQEVGLHDAKETGSLENSAQLVLGAWRPSDNEMTLKILKQTKRSGQPIIECNFDGDRQTITEIIKRPEAKTTLFGERQ